MNLEKISNYWVKNGDEKWKTAHSLMRGKRYADALFFCHLALESQLKAAVSLKADIFPPLSHNLPQLALLAGLEMSAEQEQALKEITTFNIKARYDDYKFAFYKRATKKYAIKFFSITQELRLWIKKNTL